MVNGPVDFNPHRQNYLYLPEYLTINDENIKASKSKSITYFCICVIKCNINSTISIYI